jgi:hypothetical protein
MSIALSYFSQFSSIQTQKKIKEQFQPKNLLKNFAIQYSSYLFATLMHELGHALFANFFLTKTL